MEEYEETMIQDYDDLPEDDNLPQHSPGNDAGIIIMFGRQN